MALTYALYELSKSPAMQQRVVDEVDCFGREREPTFADLAQFPFIDAVLKEGMRLHPPVTPLIGLVGYQPLQVPHLQCAACLSYHISYIIYHISYIVYHISYIVYRMYISHIIDIYAFSVWLALQKPIGCNVSCAKAVIMMPSNAPSSCNCPS